MGTLSTHVLDTSLGRPAQGVGVRLETAAAEPLGAGATDSGKASPISIYTAPDSRTANSAAALSSSSAVVAM